MATHSVLHGSQFNVINDLGAAKDGALKVGVNKALQTHHKVTHAENEAADAKARAERRDSMDAERAHRQAKSDEYHKARLKSMEASTISRTAYAAGTEHRLRMTEEKHKAQLTALEERHAAALAVANERAKNVAARTETEHARTENVQARTEATVARVKMAQDRAASKTVNGAKPKGSKVTPTVSPGPTPEGEGLSAHLKPGEYHRPAQQPTPWHEAAGMSGKPVIPKVHTTTGGSLAAQSHTLPRANKPGGSEGLLRAATGGGAKPDADAQAHAAAVAKTGFDPTKAHFPSLDEVKAAQAARRPKTPQPPSLGAQLNTARKATGN